MANTMMNHQGRPKQAPAGYQNDSVIESIRDLGGSVGATVAKDVAARVATDALTSIFGGMPSSGELKANQSILFGSPQPDRAPEAPKALEARRSEYRPAIQAVPHLEDAMLKQQIEAIRQELAMLAKSVKSMNQEVNRAVMEVPVDPGVYHLNFFEQMRSVLKMLREQVDDSRVWLSSFNSRKKKRGYWGMYKKHGTSYGLSSERTLATSTG